MTEDFVLKVAKKRYRYLDIYEVKIEDDFTSFIHYNHKEYGKCELIFELKAEIFTHPFAKAFWGEKLLEDELFLDNDHWYPFGDDLHGVEQGFSGYVWQYHLQQMVLCENPLTYLERFL
jgi:hypothetical protein